MKIVGYVLFGVGCFLFVMAAYVYNSSRSNVGNDIGINDPNGILIAGLCIWIAGIFLVSVATIREQAAERAYRKAHPEPRWDRWISVDTSEAQAASKDRMAHPE